MDIVPQSDKQRSGQGSALLLTGAPVDGVAVQRDQGTGRCRESPYAMQGEYILEDTPL